MRTKLLRDNEPYKHDTQKILRHKCCSCGSVHYINIVILDSRYVKMIFNRNRGTANVEATKEQAKR